ncbi:oxidoreductase [Marinobacter fuscus]|uniref:Oxidoreductase n=1 Tax=Marinobacter fuscus TaxID=2109942 RepID=A0A2T1KTB3_9GAMM|nr:(Fe-S)-binding protein [Marinobacter fuscus]PSF13300.1 oxidoreductase [Marinobacter fuscus]
MRELFYDAAPNATRVAPARPTERRYPAKPGRVILYGTCVVDMFFPEAGLDAIRLLEREGIAVDYPQAQTCCGQPAWTSGYADEARSVARAQLELLDNGLLVVVPSGSCAGMFRQHYRELFADEPETLVRVNDLAERTFELTEFLLHVCKVDWQDLGEPTRVALHTSCSARREMNTHRHARALLAKLANVERLDHDHESECCGFGGTFSVRMPEVSGAMVLDKTRALMESGAAEMVTADGGCLLNINGSLEKQRQTFRGRHLASFLWHRISGEARS